MYKQIALNALKTNMYVGVVVMLSWIYSVNGLFEGLQGGIEA